MKKFSVLLVMISLFTGFTTAQIKMESVELNTPQIWTLPNGPNMVVKIDTMDYYIVGVSETDTISNATTWTYYNLDRSWIKKNSSPNAFDTFEKHGLAGVKGVTIIQLNKAGERIFLLNQGLVNKPLKILMYN
jgi:hypothetical protein